MYYYLQTRNKKGVGFFKHTDDLSLEQYFTEKNTCLTEKYLKTIHKTLEHETFRKNFDKL